MSNKSKIDDDRFEIKLVSGLVVIVDKLNPNTYGEAGLTPENILNLLNGMENERREMRALVSTIESAFSGLLRP